MNNNIDQSKIREGKYAVETKCHKLTSERHEIWDLERIVYPIWHLYFILEEMKSQRDNVTFQRTQSKFRSELSLDPPKSCSVVFPHLHIVIIKSNDNGKNQNLWNMYLQGNVLNCSIIHYLI